MGCKHGNNDSGKRSISIENIFFASELQFRRLQKNELEKVQAAARFDLRPPHAIPQDSTPVLPDTSYAATIN